jgi:hypothetical protein
MKLARLAILLLSDQPMHTVNSRSVAAGEADIQIHGWDSAGWFRHEVTGILPTAREAGAVLRKLREAPAAFEDRCRVRGSPVVEFRTTAYDLADAGLAIVHEDGAAGGPIGALTILPVHRRPRLRKEFAFGFVAHLSFFDGLIKPDSELAIHDYVDELLRTDQTSTLVFTVEAAPASSDTSLVLSAYLEQLSIAMLGWLCAKDAQAECGRRGRLEAVLPAA